VSSKVVRPTNDPHIRDILNVTNMQDLQLMSVLIYVPTI
jgi:hypothetical protein